MLHEIFLSERTDYCDIVYLNVTWDLLEWEYRLLWYCLSKCYMRSFWVLSEITDYCDIVYVNVTWDRFEWENWLLWHCLCKCYMRSFRVRELIIVILMLHEIFLSEWIDYCDTVYVNVTWDLFEWENRLLWHCLSKCYMTSFWVRELIIVMLFM
jgi:hypothetical protein